MRGVGVGSAAACWRCVKTPQRLALAGEGTRTELERLWPARQQFPVLLAGQQNQRRATATGVVLPIGKQRLSRVEPDRDRWRDGRQGQRRVAAVDAATGRDLVATASTRHDAPWADVLGEQGPRRPKSAVHDEHPVGATRSMRTTNMRALAKMAVDLHVGLGGRWRLSWCGRGLGRLRNRDVGSSTGEEYESPRRHRAYDVVTNRIGMDATPCPTRRLVTTWPSLSASAAQQLGAEIYGGWSGDIVYSSQPTYDFYGADRRKDKPRRPTPFAWMPTGKYLGIPGCPSTCGTTIWRSGLSC